MTDLIPIEFGSGFTLTRLVGPKGNRCYQITVDDKLVVLTAYQMLILFEHLLRMAEKGDKI